jgi:hypothetical protein
MECGFYHVYVVCQSFISDSNHASSWLFNALPVSSAQKPVER